VRAKIRSIITDGLSTFFSELFLFSVSYVIPGELVNDPSATMRWTHYWRDVVSRHHAIIDGWPDDVPFKNLSDVSSSLPALESLLRKWESGKIFWRALTVAEFNEMDLERNVNIETGTTLEPRPRRTRSDKGKKRSRPQVRKQRDDTPESDQDTSAITFQATGDAVQEGD
jgi:hypothetical protein